MKYLNRRKFLKNGSLASFATLIGMDIVFGKNIPKGWTPVSFEKSVENLPDKHPEMRVLNDRPINAEAPAHLLNEEITSREVFFVRNNGIPPVKASIDLEKWTITIEGESVKASKSYTL